LSCPQGMPLPTQLLQSPADEQTSGLQQSEFPVHSSPTELQSPPPPSPPDVEGAPAAQVAFEEQTWLVWVQSTHALPSWPHLVSAPLIQQRPFLSQQPMAQLSALHWKQAASGATASRLQRAGSSDRRMHYLRTRGRSQNLPAPVNGASERFGQLGGLVEASPLQPRAVHARRRAMGGAAPVDNGGKGKKKSLDAIVNVVPFIDLLSCCLAFLLITAAWTQLSKLQVIQSGGPGESTAQTELVLNLSITDKGFSLSLGQTGGIEIPRAGAAYDVAGLLEQLQQIHGRFSDQRTITVSAEDSVSYDALVETIDTCIKAGLVSVSVQALG
jgi:biopolymer transport protein TolR